MDNSEIYPLYYPCSPASLQDLASTKLALITYRSRSFTPTSVLKKTAGELSSICEDVFGPLSPLIKSILAARLQSIGVELKDLFDYYYRKNETRIFFDRGDYDDTFLQCFDSFTYGPDGTMCWERSARNLLANGRLTQMEKYKISCVFCFEDDVRRLWPWVRADPQIDSPNYITEPILDYWTRRMKNDRRVPPSHRYIMGNIDRRIIGDWIIMRYMLGRGSIQDQLKDIDNLFRIGRDPFDRTIDQTHLPIENIEYFLSKLSGGLVDRILFEHSCRIIQLFAWTPKHADYLFKIWSLVQGSMTGAKFYQLLNLLCSEAFKCGYFTRELRYETGGMTIRFFEMRNPGLGCHKSLYPGNVPYDIWIRAPDDLKNIFIRDHVEKFFADLSAFDQHNVVGCYDHNMIFFSRLFADIPYESREKLWRKYWLVIAIRSRPKNLNHFLGLCLPSRHIQQFVVTEMMNYEKVESFVKFLSSNHHLADIIDYVNLSTMNKRVVREFRRRVLASNQRLLFHPNFDFLVQLANFIDGSFENADELWNFKESLFVTYDFMNFSTTKLLDNGLVNQARQLVDMFLISEPTRIEIKRLFLDYWKKFILNNELFDEFDFTKWRDFLLWCGTDRETLVDLKPLISVNKVFQSLFLETVSNAREIEFDLIDEFLSWYFIDEAEVKGFKLNRIRNYKQIESLKNTLEMANESIIDDVLGWFFDHDRDEISIFKRDVLKREVGND